jgi:hypothetical protein
MRRDSGTTKMPDPRSARFAQFLRAAVEVKIKKVTEVGKYPHVQWFSDLPEGLDEVRSPLISADWNDEDLRWLVVKRISEPDLPPPPAACNMWLEGIELKDPDAPPELLTDRVIIDSEGNDSVVQPTDEVLQQLRRYVESHWTPWARRARIARLVKLGGELLRPLPPGAARRAPGARLHQHLWVG